MVPTAVDVAKFGRGKTYRFGKSDGSNLNHALRFSTTENGTHNSGSKLLQQVLER